MFRVEIPRREKRYPLYSWEHDFSGQPQIIPIICFVTRCLGEAAPGTQKQRMCINLLHHFGLHGTWGSGNIDSMRSHAYSDLSYKRYKEPDKEKLASEEADLLEAIRVVETVLQMLEGDRYLPGGQQP